jgi:organic hydroperoxide reductase OsmC/OhrA
VRRPRRGEVVPARRTLRATARTVWTGNTGSGTASYRAYGRSHEIARGTKPPIAGSSDPMFLGEADRWNPEELQVAALSACHLLWYLHLCADAGVVVTQYADEAESTLHVGRGGDGRITHAVLRPRVTLANADDAVLAQSLHANAHARCFIANASAVPVAVEATIVIA